MCRSPWVALVVELCHHDLKLTTHHTRIEHTHHSQHKSWDLCFTALIISIPSPMISITFPPPHLHVIIMGFVESNNGCRCDLHPDGCGNSLVLERDDHHVGMELRLRMKVMDKIACYTIKPDGTDECRVSFLAKDYATSNRGVRLNGASADPQSSSTGQSKQDSETPVPLQSRLRWWQNCLLCLAKQQ